jgi:transcriptional regulator with XRE-family HTH domain
MQFNNSLLDLAMGFDNLSQMEKMGIILGRNVKRLREDRNWTQKELADRMKVHPSTILRLENGHGFPLKKTLDQLAKTFQVDSDEFLKPLDREELLPMKNLEEALNKAEQKNVDLTKEIGKLEYQLSESKTQIKSLTEARDTLKHLLDEANKIIAEKKR